MHVRGAGSEDELSATSEADVGGCERAKVDQRRRLPYHSTSPNEDPFHRLAVQSPSSVDLSSISNTLHRRTIHAPGRWTHWMPACG